MEIQEISRARAIDALQGAALCDPVGIATAADLVRNGTPFALDCADGQAVFTARVEHSERGAVLWIDGAQNLGPVGVLQVGLELAAEMARQSDCDAVAFETNRVGLVRAAQAHGYEIVGYVMKKAVNHG